MCLFTFLIERGFDNCKFEVCILCESLTAKRSAIMAESEPVVERRTSRVEEKDEEVLAEFGYKQELRRDWGLTHNFGISFSIIVSSSSPAQAFLDLANYSRSLLSPVLRLCSNMAW